MPADGETLGVGLPHRFNVEHNGGGLSISWHLPRWVAAPVALFAGTWSAFLIAFYRGLLAGDAPTPVLVAPAVHVVVGVGLVYFLVVALVNRTTVRVGQGEITVRRGPLPWPGNRTLQAADLAQLFCVERSGSKGGSTYAVMARLRSGREVTLVSGLREDRQARFLEQELEKHLRIDDQPVAGELPG